MTPSSMTSRAIYSNEPAKGWLPWGLLAPFLCIVIVVVPVLVLWPFELQLGLVDENGDTVGLAGLLTLLFVEFAATGLLLLAWVRYVERRPLTTIGFLGPRPARALGRGQLVGFATSTVVVAAIWIAGGYQASEPFKALGSGSALAAIAALWAGFLVQSGVEEILFRGWLLSAVTRKLGLAWGVVLSTTVFTLLHAGPHQRWDLILSTVLFALFACALAIRDGNIWGVMGWHAGWNWLISVGFEVPITGVDAKQPALLVQLTPVGPEWLTGGGEGPEGSALCSLFFVVAIGYLVWQMRRRAAAKSTPAGSVGGATDLA